MKKGKKRLGMIVVAVRRVVLVRVQMIGSVVDLVQFVREDIV